MIGTALVALPAAAGLLCGVPVLSRAARAIAATSGLAVVALAGAAVRWPDAAPARLPWAAPLAVEFSVGVDGLSAVLLALVGVLFSLGALASAGVPDRRGYFALWCLVLAAIDGVLVARDLGLFSLSWVAMLVGVALLVRGWGGRGRREAAGDFLARTLAASAPLLVVVASLAALRGTLDMATLAARPLAADAQLLPAMLALAPFAMVLPLFPLHGWLPRVVVAAPVPVAIVVAGALSSAAAYGVVRVCVGLFPSGVAAAAPILVSLAAVGVWYGALVALRQDDVRRLLAFASLSSVDLVAIGAFAATATGIRGGVLASVSHGLLVAVALLAASVVARRTSSFSLQRAGGLAASMPALAGIATVASLAWAGAPLTSGFAAHVTVIAGAYARFPAAATVAAAALVVTAAAVLRLVRRTYHGPPLAHGADIPWRERLLLVAPLALAVAIGIVPAIVTDRIAGDALRGVGMLP